MTDRSCDRGVGLVSPLYMAVLSPGGCSVDVLLSDGFSPDAQDCTCILGLHSPLSFALSHMSDVKPYRLVRQLRPLAASGRRSDAAAVFQRGGAAAGGRRRGTERRRRLEVRAGVRSDGAAAPCPASPMDPVAGQSEQRLISSASGEDYGVPAAGSQSAAPCGSEPAAPRRLLAS